MVTKVLFFAAQLFYCGDFAMRYLKRDMWKVGIALAGLLLFLVLMVWLPVSAVDAYERTLKPNPTITATVQTTPTEDATVAVLNKEKLVQEIQQLKNQNEPDPLGWLRTNAAIFLSTLVVVIGGLIGLFRWFGDRRSEREKRAEERFQIVVSGLGSKDIEAKVGAAIMLRTFLKPGYEQFYRQSFELAVGHLQLRQVNANEPIDPLSQVLIKVFTESSRLVRIRLGLEYLDAAHVRLDGAYLARVDLQRVWMRDAFFIGANLHRTNLHESDLIRANFHKADLEGADLSKTSLRRAILSGAILTSVNLNGADLYGANLTGAIWNTSDMRDATLEDATVKGTDLRRVTGLDDTQKEAFKAKGAIIDEDTATSPSQSPVSPPSPSQSSGAQAPSAPTAQVNTPPPDTDGNSAGSSQPNPEP
jgi:uncharacterized protein YjbI with pentapeptide repeats